MTTEPKFSASGIINALEHRLHDKYPMVSDVTDLFCDHLQIVLDEFEKVASGTVGGQVGFAQRYLLSQFINDLLVGFHLIRQGYSKQAFAVLRTPMEAADIIKLLDKDPTQVKYWIAGGKQSYDELSPAKVRKKLGQPRNSPVERFYHLLSELGTHPGFLGSRNHAAQDAKTKEIHIWVGGKLFQHSFLFGSLHCFVMTLQLWSSFDVVYRDSIKSGEFSSVMKRLATNLRTLTNMYPDFFNQKADGKSFADIADELINFASKS